MAPVFGGEAGADAPRPDDRLTAALLREVVDLRAAADRVEELLSEAGPRLPVPVLAHALVELELSNLTAGAVVEKLELQLVDFDPEPTV